MAAASAQLGWWELWCGETPPRVFLLTVLLLQEGDEASMVHLEFYSSMN